MTQVATDWLDTLPKHWQRLRLKDIGYLYGGLTGKSGDDFRSENEEGTKPFIPFTNILNNQYIDFSQFKSVVMSEGEEQNAVHENDILFLMSSEDYESIAKAAAVVGNPGEVYLNSFCKGFRLTRKDVSAAFLCYLLACSSSRDSLRYEAQGFTRINIKSGKVSSTGIAFPSIQEQEKIVRYLDRKNLEIDGYISDRMRELQLLKQFKQAKINESVLRGLSPDSPKMESGVSWIGLIPQGWKIRRMKEIFEESAEVSLTGEEDLLSVSEYYGVAKRKDRMTEDDEYETRADSLEGYKICHKGDLVSNIMLTWKRALGISEFEGIVSPAYAVYRGKDIFPKYYHYLLRSDAYVAEFKRNSKGIIESRLRLYTDRFYSIKAVYPPLDEQRAIADYLDRESQLIDKKCALIEQQIEKLQLLKRALVNEVVTGKRQIQ